MDHKAVLVLEEGSVFEGRCIGVSGIATGEVIFNTAMAGYEEILSDPSYAGQMIAFTYPHIGNTGIHFEDLQSEKIYANGVIMREQVDSPSHFRSKCSLQQFLKAQNITGIDQIDTRALTHLLREKGALKGCIMAGDINLKAALSKAKAQPSLIGRDLASTVSTQNPKAWGDSTAKHHIVVLDFGVKRSIITALLALGVRVTVMPAHSSVADLCALKPHGIVLSNGPGDPKAMSSVIEMLQALLTHSIPILGICLGCQLLALALGAKTIKMSFGHHGCNHPIQDLATGQVYITSQNHGFCIEGSSLPDTLSITHRSLFDQSIQGIRHLSLPILGLQGHPEAAPGPLEARDFFADFFNPFLNAIECKPCQSVMI